MQESRRILMILVGSDSIDIKLTDFLLNHTLSTGEVWLSKMHFVILFNHTLFTGGGMAQ